MCHGTCACLPLSLNGPKGEGFLGGVVGGDAPPRSPFKEIKDAAPYAEMPPFSHPFSGVGSV